MQDDMREKLKKRINDRIIYHADEKKYRYEIGKGVMSCLCDDIMKDFSEFGGILLPCEFQQKVYVLPTIENKLHEITEMKCIGFSLSCDSYVVNLITDKNKLYQPCFGRFGKTVFLTKEEAGKALERME